VPDTPGHQMDEWDDFLAASTTEVVLQEDESEETTSVLDLGDFEGNAEVMMQMARGENLNQLSNNGVWIKSTISPTTTATTTTTTITAANRKRNHSSDRKPPHLNNTSHPIANSVEDLKRALCGHPLLSFPLQQLKQRFAITQGIQVFEIDSLGLFFYGSPGDVKITSNVQDDFMKVIEIKNQLIGKSLRTTQPTSNHMALSLSSDISQPSLDMIISLENYKILANCLPPNGKTNWILPFHIDPTSLTIDLASERAILPEFCSSELDLLFEFCSQSINSHLEAPQLITEAEHLVSIDQNFNILVKTTCPPINVSLNFRGSKFDNCFPDSAVNSLFSRQANYSVEVDFENNLTVTAIKSFVPKFDPQNRSHLLFKALKEKLSKLPPSTRHFLVHVANSPFIKIFSSVPIESAQVPIHLDSIFKK
jgi:hypothetical protein